MSSYAKSIIICDKFSNYLTEFINDSSLQYFALEVPNPVSIVNLVTPE